MGVTLVLLAIAVLVVLYFCIKYGKSALRVLHLEKKIRRPSFAEFIIFHLKDFFSDDMITCFWKMTEDFEYKPWGLWFYFNYTVMISDAETLEELFKNKNLAEKPNFFYDELEKFSGKSIMTKGGTTHKIHRKIINPAFKKTFMESNQLPHINKEAMNIVQLLHEEAKRGSVDVHVMIEERICEASIAVLFSGLCTYPNIAELCRSVKAGLEDIQVRIVNPLYYWLVYRWTKKARHHKGEIESLKVHFKEMFYEVKQLCTERKKESIDWEPSNAFELMLKGQMELGEEEFTDEDMMSETRALVIGSLDPIGFIANVCLLVLAIHPDVQERVFQEQKSIFGQSGRCVEPKDLSQMVYLELVIKETLRLIPLAPVCMRKAENETCLNGIILPKGCHVIINIMALHRNPDYFKDPLKFDPDRFRPENSVGRPPCAFIPFSVGNRTCIGQAQAMLFLRTILSHIVRNVQILPGDGFRCMDDIKIKMSTFMTLQHYPLLRFISRNR